MGKYFHSIHSFPFHVQFYLFVELRTYDKKQTFLFACSKKTQVLVFCVEAFEQNKIPLIQCERTETANAKTWRKLDSQVK